MKTPLITKTLLFSAFINLFAAMTAAKSQTYDPLAVQRISDLIFNNGLNATPYAPASWDFAVWDNNETKQIIELVATNCTD